MNGTVQIKEEGSEGFTIHQIKKEPIASCSDVTLPIEESIDLTKDDGIPSGQGSGDLTRVRKSKKKGRTEDDNLDKKKQRLQRKAKKKQEMQQQNGESNSCLNLIDPSNPKPVSEILQHKTDKKRVKRGRDKNFFKRNKKSVSSSIAEEPRTYNNSAAQMDNQIVFMSDRKGGVITPEEANELKQSLVTSMMETMLGPDGQPQGPELRFKNSCLIETGWLLVTVKNKVSGKWLLDQCIPVIGDVTFKTIIASEAPWPEKIGFFVKSLEEIDLVRIRTVLALQNRKLNIDDWKHMDTSRNPVGSFITFLVNSDTISHFTKQNWELYYEMVTLPVKRLSFRKVEPASTKASHIRFEI